MISLLLAAGLIREGLFLAAIDHPHVLKVHAWTSPNGWMDFAALNASKEGDLYDGYLLVLERLKGGSLKGWMRKWHDDHADEQRAIAHVAAMEAADEKKNNSSRSFRRLSFTASSSRDDSNSKPNSFSFSNHRHSSRLRHTVLKKKSNNDDDELCQHLLSPEDTASISPGSASTRDSRSSDRPFTYTSNWPTTQLSDRTSLLLQLSDTVKYLHKHRILHRDLKPDNLGVTFVDEPQISNNSSKERQYPTSLSLKVFDFDIARLVPEDPKKVDELSLLSSHKKRKVKRTASNGSMQSFEPSTHRTRDVRSVSPSRSSHAMMGDKHGSNHRRRAKKYSGQKPGRQGSNHTDASSESATAASQKQDALFEMTAKMGSPRYMAPEIARGEPYNLRSEVYTVCLLVHEVLTLQKPYDELAPENHSKLVHFDLPGYRPPVFSSWGWPTELQDVLHRGWGDITQRPSMKEVHSVLKRALPKLCPELVQPPPPNAQAELQTASMVATKLSTTEQQPPLSKSQLQPPPQKEPKKKGRGLFHRTPKKSGKSRKPRSTSLTPTASNSDFSMSNDEPRTMEDFY
jgi:serine/threonine protein kinase